MARHLDSEDDWHETAMLFAALGHPLRIRTLTALRSGELSPAQLARLMADPAASLALLSYHFQRLARAGLIEVTSTRQRRGAIEHRYRLTPRGRRATRMIGRARARPQPRG